MTIEELHDKNKVPMNIIRYAIKAGILLQRDGQLLETANLRRFQRHSKDFDAKSISKHIDDFWKSCTLIMSERRYRVYDHRKKVNNYFTVITKDGAIETFMTLQQAKAYIKHRYEYTIKKSKKKYVVRLTLEQIYKLLRIEMIYMYPDITKILETTLLNYSTRKNPLPKNLLNFDDIDSPKSQVQNSYRKSISNPYKYE